MDVYARGFQHSCHNVAHVAVHETDGQAQEPRTKNQSRFIQMTYLMAEFVLAAAPCGLHNSPPCFSLFLTISREPLFIFHHALHVSLGYRKVRVSLLKLMNNVRMSIGLDYSP